jgi:UMF1 family MFS transporter
MKAVTNKTKKAWAFYDWANSVYNLIITTAIFPIYYNAVTTEMGGKVSFLGFSINNSAFYEYILAFAYLLIVLAAPFLSGIADYGGKKKGFMMFFCYLGSSACISMYFFQVETFPLGIIAIILACLGWTGSVVFYNAYLPEIAPKEEQDMLSAKGYALGYFGSALLLIICLVMIMKFEIFGFSSTGEATRFSFLITGLWWMLFAQYTFYYLPRNIYDKIANGSYLSNGLIKTKSVYNSVKQNIQLKNYLIAFFTYNMGVQTLMLIATLFGSKELGMETSELITTVLIIQFVAIAGSYGFSFTAKTIGNINTLQLATVIWMLVCFAGMFLQSSFHFYIAAGFIGLVMGGIQALSRSTYSKMLPETQDHASYFSFYDICDKLGIVLGMALFGLIDMIFDSMRQPVLLLFVFFLTGFLLLRRVKNYVSL